MKSSQFEAKTFGLGELISQRKLFRVPKHQRSFSWTADAVEALLSDITTAFSTGSSEYFVGLIVIQGPVDGEWTLLDGQQRLTTISLLYAAIRTWLRDHHFEDDAKQIESEFLVVRRLGGEFSSRMVLNDDNRALFEQVVLGTLTGANLAESARAYPRRSSNRNLAESAIACERWVLQFADPVAPATSSSLLYRLANYVETRVKVVSVEVSSDVDAYILFESLNDRGVELSAFDLLKNYLYSKIEEHAASALEQEWRETVENLEQANPDDFLKVFWTARHGIIQKALLFRSLREKYPDHESAVKLVHDIRVDSALIAAVDDPRDPFWNDFPSYVRSHVSILNVLGSKQIRPVVLSAIHKLSMPLFDQVLWHLIVAVVRFQIIGKGRTGVVERVFGRVCRAISEGALGTEASLVEMLSELRVEDADFVESFRFHTDSKPARYTYLLWEIEKNLGNHDVPSFEESSEKYALEHIFPNASLSGEERALGLGNRIGNFALVERDSQHELTNFAEKLAKSELQFSRVLSSVVLDEKPRVFVEARSKILAEAASSIWTHRLVSA